jgi:DNA-binding Lrp family transcriptional regulator
MRQKAFLSKLADLYAEARQPLHYSRIAEGLGVSPATAYDMLKVLERKGMVRCEYLLPDRPAGPGRANVVFAPTELANELFARLVGDTSQDREWEETKARLLFAVRNCNETKYCDLLDEILDHAPKASSPLAYVGEMITAMLLSLREEKYKFGPRSPLSIAMENTGGKFGLSMIAGMAFGLTTNRSTREHRWPNLGEHLRRLEAATQELSAQRSQDLREFVGELVTTLQSDSTVGHTGR